MKPVIASYWWQPDAGSKFAHPYTGDDVRRLQKMVAKHCTVPHQFAVITDQVDEFEYDHDIRAIPIDWATHVPGTCYVRLMTFHPEGRERIGEQVLVIDLDSLIVGNIDHLVTRPESIVLWRNPGRLPWADVSDEDRMARFGCLEKSICEIDGAKKTYLINQLRPYYNTSVVFHRPGSHPDIWHDFIAWKDSGRLPAKDDQWYLSDLFGMMAPYFDGERDGVYRLARTDTPGSGIDGELPPHACIVTFPGSHGKPGDPAVLAANPWLEAHLCLT